MLCVDLVPVKTVFFEDENLLLSSLVSLYYSAWCSKDRVGSSVTLQLLRKHKHLAFVLCISSQEMQNTSQIANCLINPPSIYDELVAKIISNNDAMNIKHFYFQSISTYNF